MNEVTSVCRARPINWAAVFWLAYMAAWIVVPIAWWLL